MAEITTISTGKGKKGSRRSKKLNTRVDLTPMVDLGFLLITFFMLTTQWREPKSMHIFLPAQGTPTPVSERVTLTLIPLNNNRVFYYEGEWNRAILTHQFGVSHNAAGYGIEKIIRAKQEALAHDPLSKNGRKDLMIIIKPDAECNLGNLVNTIDEMTIQDVGSYAIADLEKPEIDYLEKNRFRD
jgi:biopolymer transport protein ExbD